MVKGKLHDRRMHPSSFCGKECSAFGFYEYLGIFDGLIGLDFQVAAPAD
jgi:hypothetical protein